MNKIIVTEFKFSEKQSRVKILEKEIDQLVYKLYVLTPEEIAIVENFQTGSKMNQ